MTASRPLVLVSWDGASEPWRMLHRDATPDFDWVLFDYSGRHADGTTTVDAPGAHVLSQRTECKGDIYQALAAHLAAMDSTPEYVGLIDDDVMLSVSQINGLLHVARCTGLDVCSATLTHDSDHSHRWMLTQGSRRLREVAWVEVMMPFYRGALFRAGQPHYAGNVSSWGIDRYLIPTLQQLHGMTRTALLDGVVASHLRTVTSGHKVYRNGRTARQEGEAMKAHCEALVREHLPHLVGSRWYDAIFRRRRVETRWQRIAQRIGRPLRRWLDHSV